MPPWCRPRLWPSSCIRVPRLGPLAVRAVGGEVRHAEAQRHDQVAGADAARDATASSFVALPYWWADDHVVKDRPAVGVEVRGLDGVERAPVVAVARLGAQHLLVRQDVVVGIARPTARRSSGPSPSPARCRREARSRSIRRGWRPGRWRTPGRRRRPRRRRARGRPSRRSPGRCPCASGRRPSPAGRRRPFRRRRRRVRSSPSCRAARHRRCRPRASG